MPQILIRAFDFIQGQNGSATRLHGVWLGQVIFLFYKVSRPAFVDHLASHSVGDRGQADRA